MTADVYTLQIYIYVSTPRECLFKVGLESFVFPFDSKKYKD